jgi:uncharacterized membrane protein
MVFVHQAGAALLLVILTLWVQSAGVAALIGWLRHAATGDIHRLGPFRSAGLVVQLTTAVVALHALNILLWLNLHKGTRCDIEFSISPFFVSTYSTSPAPKKTPSLRSKIWELLN